MLRDRLLFTWIAAASLLGCGARSQLEGAGVTGLTAGGGGTRTGGGGSAPADVCPSAVSGPRPMMGNCSTRDGRSRVSAPSAPHVTWTTKLPVDTSGQVGPSAVVTDGSGNAYVLTTGEFDESVTALRKVRASDGTIAWTDPVMPDQEFQTPIVLSQGGVDVWAYAPMYTDAVYTFDPATGASTSTTFGFMLYDAAPYLAVGADGSLYVTHSANVGSANPVTYVSRVAPGGQVLWTTADLATLVPPPDDPGDISPSPVALGQDDLVVIVVGVILKTGEISAVLGLDPATGTPRWGTTLPGEYIGGPAVRPDGSIAVILNVGGASQIAILDSHTGVPALAPIANGAFEIYAVTEGGVVISGADAGMGVTGLVAIQGDGTVLWTHPGPGQATIARDGTIVGFGPSITAIDPATGDTKWDLAPPDPGQCIADAALTSEGGIVALQCDGTLFGASD